MQDYFENTVCEIKPPQVNYVEAIQNTVSPQDVQLCELLVVSQPFRVRHGLCVVGEHA